MGLDWGTGPSIKYVLVRRSGLGNPAITAFGRIPIIADAPEAMLETAQALHELFLRERSLKRAKIVVGLGTDKVVLKKESFPALSPKEIGQTILFGMQKDLGLEGEERGIVFDYLLLDKDPSIEGNREYFCFGAEASSVSEKCRVLANEGNIPVKIIPSAIAYSRLLTFLPPEKAGDAICFLDIGAVRSALVFFMKGQIDFVREIVIGGDDFTKAITGTIFHEGRAIQFTNKEALEFKIKHGYPLGFSEGMTFRGAPLGEVGAMMRPVVERLTGEIHRSIGFYKEKTGGNPVHAVYLLGGGSRLRHLPGVLSERLDIPTSILPFPAGLKIAGGLQQEQIFQSRLLEFGPALSLALETEPSANLLPHAYRKIHRIKSTQRILALAAAAVLFLLAVFSVLGYFERKNLENKSQSLEKRANQAQSQAARFEKFSVQKVGLTGQIAGLEKQTSQNPDLVPLLKAVSNSLPRNLSVSRIWMGLEEETPSDLGSASKPGTRRSKKETSGEKAKGEKKKMDIFIIRGDSKASAPDVQVSVAQFMLSLSKSGYLNDVKLQDERIIEETGMYDFTITGMVNFQP